MNPRLFYSGLGLLLGFYATTKPSVCAQSPLGLQAQLYAGITVTGNVGVAYSIQATTNLAVTNDWLTLAIVDLPYSPWLFIDYDSPGIARRFYRAVDLRITNMFLIPEGSFQMGNAFNNDFGAPDEFPRHSVYVSGFYMDKYQVTKALWNRVYQWATNYGYSFGEQANGYGLGSWQGGTNYSKGTNHPVHLISWYDAVKWCNARAEKDGRTPAYYTSAAQTTPYRTGQVDLQEGFVKWNAGYRLPTEAEWEKAARGGATGRRFPWADADTITHDRANYFSTLNDPLYDISSTRGYHPAFKNSGVYPYTSPVGYFAANGYGLYDMAGNVWEWCWDWWDENYYSSSPGTDPRGPATGASRTYRGGSWGGSADSARVAKRYNTGASFYSYSFGFRCVLPVGQ